jgi:hypothetical protein
MGATIFPDSCPSVQNPYIHNLSKKPGYFGYSVTDFVNPHDTGLSAVFLVTAYGSRFGRVWLQVTKTVFRTGYFDNTYVDGLSTKP